jgi:hypothetical protein
MFDLNQSIHIYKQLYMPVLLIPALFVVAVLFRFALKQKDPYIERLELILASTEHTEEVISRIESSNQEIIKILNEKIA